MKVTHAKEGYKQVPVEVGMNVCHNFDKDQAIIVSVDKAHDKLHFTTYGRSTLDKIEAANAGDWIAEQLGILLAKHGYADFRSSPALQMIAAERAEKLAESAEADHPSAAAPPTQPAKEGCHGA